MANDQLTSLGEPDPFLDYLLRCAVSAPGAVTSSTASRLLARLLVASALEGSSDLITPYLVPQPGVGATFEVRTHSPGNLVPTQHRGGLRADAALKMAVRSAHSSDEAVEVVSQTRSGLERRVLVREPSGDLEYLFAGSETLVGDPSECRNALQAWTATLSAWQAASPPPGGAPMGTDEVAGATSSPFSNGRLPDPLSAAIRDAIGNLVVEVDLSQVEPLIRRALDAERRDMAEPLAERLSLRLIDSLSLRDTESLAKAVVNAVALVVPNPSDLAQAIATEVGGVLAKTPPGNRPDALGGVEGWRFTIAMEQLQLRLDAVQDQLHKSTEVLQVMGDRIESGDRSAALTERLATAADQELHQLVRRIDEQLSALAARAGGAEEGDLPDDVARLTRKLRQSVAQFDRAVARMDARFEESAALAEPPA